MTPKGFFQNESYATRLDCLEHDVRASNGVLDIAMSTIHLLRLQLRSLQGVVGSLQQDIATLEMNFDRMEHGGICTDDVDQGAADRADFERFMEQEYQAQECPESRSNGYGAANLL